MTIIRGISLLDSANLDAFARLRVSQPSAFFDAKMTTGILATRWLQSTANGGTVVAR